MNLSANRHRLLTVTGVAGIGYTLSWLAGLSVAAPSPKLTASGTEITAALAGHGTAVAAQFALTEGLPAAGLAIISLVALASDRAHAQVRGDRGRPGRLYRRLLRLRSSRWPSSRSAWSWLVRSRSRHGAPAL